MPKISQEPDAGGVTDTDYFVIVDDIGGTPTTKRADAADVKTYMEAGMHDGSHATITHSASGALTLNFNDSDHGWKVTASDAITDITTSNGPTTGNTKKRTLEIVATASVTIAVTSATVDSDFPSTMENGDSLLAEVVQVDSTIYISSVVVNVAPSAYPGTTRGDLMSGVAGFGRNACSGYAGYTAVEVINTNDSGAGSFRDAVGTSNRWVTFASGLSGSTITLSSTVVVASDVVIDGRDVVAALTINGNGQTAIEGPAEDFVIHNVNVECTSGDALALTSCNNFWVDQCTLGPAGDGSLDITTWRRQTAMVGTVSRTLIKDEVKNCLIKTTPNLKEISYNQGGEFAWDTDTVYPVGMSATVPHISVTMFDTVFDDPGTGFRNPAIAGYVWYHEVRCGRVGPFGKGIYVDHYPSSGTQGPTPISSNESYYHGAQVVTERPFAKSDSGSADNYAIDDDGDTVNVKIQVDGNHLLYGTNPPTVAATAGSLGSVNSTMAAAIADADYRAGLPADVVMDETLAASIIAAAGAS